MHPPAHCGGSGVPRCRLMHVKAWSGSGGHAEQRHVQPACHAAPATNLCAGQPVCHCHRLVDARVVCLGEDGGWANWRWRNWHHNCDNRIACTCTNRPSTSTHGRRCGDVLSRTGPSAWQSAGWPPARGRLRRAPPMTPASGYQRGRRGMQWAVQQRRGIHRQRMHLRGQPPQSSTAAQGMPAAPLPWCS